MKLQRIQDAPSGKARVILLIGIEETELLLGCLLNASKRTPDIKPNTPQRARLNQMRRELIKGLEQWSHY